MSYSNDSTSTMSTIPTVLLTSVNTSSALKLVECFSHFAPLTQVEGAKETFQWNIDTKYYTAKVHLRVIQTPEQLQQLEHLSAEAIVIHCDCTNEKALIDINSWLPFLKSEQPSVRLLLFDSISNIPSISTAYANEATRTDVLQYCLRNQFELIDLNDKNDADEEDDESDRETKGFARMKEALESHPWSNLCIKSKNGVSSSDEQIKDDSSGNQINHIDRILDELTLEDETLEFSNLFGKLNALRESVKDLSLPERRRCAEQVVAAFWNAVGGDPTEFD